MIRHATIREVAGDRVVVACGPAGGCKNCSNAFCSGGGESRFEAANPERLPVCPGDVVELDLPPGKTVAAGFVALILPLAFFVLAYLVASRLGSPEALAALAGLGGIAAGFLVSLALRRVRAIADRPAITAVLARAPEISATRSG